MKTALGLCISGLLLIVGSMLGGCERRPRAERPVVAADDPGIRVSPSRGMSSESRGLLSRRPASTRRAPTRPAPMRPEQTVDFAYRDQQLLVSGQRRGGRVWVPRHRRRRRVLLPMVVVLHGIDKSGRRRAHRLLDGAADLRPTVRRLVRSRKVQPVLLAAPSQTRKAKGASTLWTPTGFDVASFVAAAERQLKALGVGVDRTRLAVVGHSGAGCYLAGGDGNGLFHLIRGLPELRRRGLRIRWVGFMDTCFFGGYGAHWLRRALRDTDTRAAAMWTGPREWGRRSYRRVSAFTRAFGKSPMGQCDPERYSACRAGPDGGWIFAARRQALQKAFGDRSGRAAPINPHWGLTRWFMEELLTRWLPT